MKAPETPRAMVAMFRARCFPAYSTPAIPAGEFFLRFISLLVLHNAFAVIFHHDITPPTNNKNTLTIPNLIRNPSFSPYSSFSFGKALFVGVSLIFIQEVEREDWIPAFAGMEFSEYSGYFPCNIHYYFKQLC
jgi:hypothetical protein